MANQLKMAKIDAILALDRRQWSIRRIAKELGISRKAVARHIRLGATGVKGCQAPIGVLPIMLGAKAATLEGGAHDANQAPRGGLLWGAR